MLEHGLQHWGPLTLHSVLVAMQASFHLQVHLFAQCAMLVLGQMLLERHRHLNVRAVMKGCFHPYLEQRVTLLVTHVLLARIV